MSQSQVWKRRSAGLAEELKDLTRTWLNPQDTIRPLLAAASDGKRKAGLKRRKY
jgi:hypothetical protein